MNEFAWTSRAVREALGLPPGSTSGRPYRAVSSDSRTAQPGDLFVALRGERFNGVDFVGEAVGKGAAGAVVERLPGGSLGAAEIFQVRDSRAALGRLARYRRRAVSATVVAITGTNGKTTVKEILGRILAAAGPTYASPGNLNNLVGVPLSLLSAPEDARYWVIELGTNQPGEIRALGEIAEPDVGVITSVEEGHLEGLRDLAGVLAEKTSLLKSVRRGGWAIVSDEPAALAQRAKAMYPAVRTAGLGPAAEERPDRWASCPDHVELMWRGVSFRLGLVGRHNARNLMLALAAARLLGVAPRQAAPALNGFEPLWMREEVRRLGDLILFVDCYNANPGSFVAAIDAVASRAGARPRAAFVGTMLELGSQSAALHARVARALVEGGFGPIAATGAFAEAFEPLQDALGDRLVRAAKPADAYPPFADKLSGREVVLLKASRGVALETVIPLFERDFH